MFEENHEQGYESFYVTIAFRSISLYDWLRC